MCVAIIIKVKEAINLRWSRGDLVELQRREEKKEMIDMNSFKKTLRFLVQRRRTLLLVTTTIPKGSACA